MSIAEKMLIVGTHNGIFHPDEVVAISIISLVEENILVERSRDPEKLSNCDILVDIGGGKYDHHMPGGNGKRTNNIPYASCGLVWKEYGERLLRKFGAEEDILHKCFDIIDARIITPVDELDNGITAQTPFQIVESFIPNWNEDNVSFYLAFTEAQKVVEVLLEKIIKKEIASVSAERLLNKLISQRDISNIIEIPCQCFPWTNRLVNYNKFEGQSPIDFVIYPYPSGGYAGQCVPQNTTDKFSKRIPFPERWAGESDNLPVLSGVKTARFCHNNRFFVRADTKEDVILLCQAANE